MVDLRTPPAARSGSPKELTGHGGSEVGDKKSASQGRCVTHALLILLAAQPCLRPDEVMMYFLTVLQPRLLRPPLLLQQ